MARGQTRLEEMPVEGRERGAPGSGGRRAASSDAHVDADGDQLPVPLRRVAWGRDLRAVSPGRRVALLPGRVLRIGVEPPLPVRDGRGERGRHGPARRAALADVRGVHDVAREPAGRGVEDDADAAGHVQDRAAGGGLQGVRAVDGEGERDQSRYHAVAAVFLSSCLVVCLLSYYLLL